MLSVRLSVLAHLEMQLLFVLPFLVWAARRRHARRSIALFCAVYVVIIAIQVYAGWFFSLDRHWEGAGEAIGIFVCLLLVKWLPDLDRRQVGMKLTQKPGSIAPSLVVCLVVLMICAWKGKSIDEPSLEVFLTTAVAAGLYEELLFRGILPALFDQASRSRWRIFGAELGVSALCTSVLFGTSHAVFVFNGELEVMMASLLSATGFGLVGCWLRVRTGSLLLPVLLHNTVNGVILLL
jgi:membrane protease YdiL (CAAX protease family)